MKKEYRNVHVDFHTGGKIEDIGTKFNKEEFKQTIIDAHVDSINVFAKCHHGYCYYPTKLGTVYPTLKFDLLGAELEAAKEAGVIANVYITVGFNELDAEQHPEWMAYKYDTKEPYYVDYDVNAKPTDPRPFSSWRPLCLNNPEYQDYLLQITEEVCQMYNPDGLFYDICTLGDACYCPACVKGMKEQGLDPDNYEDARKYYIERRLAFSKRVAECQHKYNKEGLLFFNNASEVEQPELCNMNNYLSMEDLPTFWGGYDKLPLRARALEKTGKHIIGMTGKFHKTWGEFGGFKNPEALRYEVASMLAYGVGCSIGDHMHPCAQLDHQTYKNIGYAYSYADEIGDWCKTVEAYSKLGLVLARERASIMGISKMLLDKQIDFTVTNGEDDLEKLTCVIVPNNAILSDTACKNLENFAREGGKLVLLGNAVDRIKVGITTIGENENELDYIVRDGVTSLAYGKANKVKYDDGYKVLAEIKNPYFNRTYENYCGHDNTPYQLTVAEYPACVKNNSVLYFAHDLGKSYDQSGSWMIKTYFTGIFADFWSDNVVEAEGMMSLGRLSFNIDKEARFYTLHLMYAAPSQKGICNVLEDFPPMRDVKIKLHISDKIKSARMMPQNKKIKLKKTKDGYSFIVPDWSAHQLIVFEI